MSTSNPQPTGDTLTPDEAQPTQAKGPYSAPIKHLWNAAPKHWVGLTADEMLEALTVVDPATKRLPIGFTRFAQAIEAKLREKNGGA